MNLAQIAADTQFGLTLSAACLGIGSIVMSVWRAANYLRDVRDKLEGLTRAVEQCWTKHDQERWAYRLERDNRDIKLTVPQVNDDAKHGP